VLDALNARRMMAGVRRLSWCEAMKLPGSITILLLLLVAAYGQAGGSLKVFDPVPANQRARLAERLKLAVSLTYVA
jgi:hypothetical protein